MLFINPRPTLVRLLGTFLLFLGQELTFSDDPQGSGDVDGVTSGSVSAQGLAMVGVNRRMASNAAVYTVHIGLEHSHVSLWCGVVVVVVMVS